MDEISNNCYATDTVLNWERTRIGYELQQAVMRTAVHSFQNKECKVNGKGFPHTEMCARPVETSVTDTTS
jgi:hypothetical protein